MPLCQPTASHRFATTTTGYDGDYFADPTARSTVPVIGRGRALRNFEQAYGPLTKAQAANTEIRFGRVSYVGSGPASHDPLGFVPFVRRTKAWLISNCVNPSTPASLRDREFAGTMVAAVADQPKPELLEADWSGRHRHGPAGQTRSSLFQPLMPRARATPFRSVRWHVVGKEKHGAELLRYHAPRCYTFDHLNVEDVRHVADVAVIMSGGPGTNCPKPSATAPFVELVPPYGSNARPARLRHMRTGPVKYAPSNA